MNKIRKIFMYGMISIMMVGNVSTVFASTDIPVTGKIAQHQVISDSEAKEVVGGISEIVALIRLDIVRVHVYERNNGKNKAIRGATVKMELIEAAGNSYQSQSETNGGGDVWAFLWAFDLTTGKLKVTVTNPKTGEVKEQIKPLGKIDFLNYDFQF